MLHLRDRYNHCPLWDATTSRSLPVVKLLRKAGAHFSEEQGDEVAAALVRAASSGDVDMIKILDVCGVDFNRTSQDDRTPLHVVSVEKEGKDWVQYL